MDFITDHNPTAALRNSRMVDWFSGSFRRKKQGDYTVILIVDDDPTFLERARDILNRTRRVFFAQNSQKAMELAQDLGFSVMLVDLDLGHEDGLMLIRKVHDKFPGLPIIAISESPQKPIIELAQEFGAVEILNKPITHEWKPVVERVRATASRT